MKALTICQPYAALIVRGDKLVENRNWPTNYRGRILIHAGKSREWLDEDEEQEFADGGDPLIFGAVVGEARLADCLPIARIQLGHYDMKYPWLKEHMHAHGPWCWVLADVKRYDAPIPWKGADPVGFLDTVAAELKDMRAENVKLKGTLSIKQDRVNDLEKALRDTLRQLEKAINGNAMDDDWIAAELHGRECLYSQA